MKYILSQIINMVLLILSIEVFVIEGIAVTTKDSFI
jgi:hypothetical protein